MTAHKVVTEDVKGLAAPVVHKDVLATAVTVVEEAAMVHVPRDVVLHVLELVLRDVLKDVPRVAALGVQVDAVRDVQEDVLALALEDAGILVPLVIQDALPDVVLGALRGVRAIVALDV